jgi:hypothetical protein
MRRVLSLRLCDPWGVYFSRMLTMTTTMRGQAVRFIVRPANGQGNGVRHVPFLSSRYLEPTQMADAFRGLENAQAGRG